MRSRVRSTYAVLVHAVLVCALWLWPQTSQAQEPSAASVAAIDAFDAELAPLVAELSPGAEAAWAEANAAQDREEFEAAIAGYSQVLDAHPDFDHARRRRCTGYLRLEDYANAKADCERALALDASGENRVALALVLATAPAPHANYARARGLAVAAIDAEDVDFAGAGLACEVALALDDAKLLWGCTDVMARIDGKAWETQVFTAFSKGMDGKSDAAFAALERARAGGLDEANYAELHTLFEQTFHPGLFYGKRALTGLGAWAGLAFSLMFAAFVLSRMTLAEAERALTSPSASAKASDSALRKVYALVLWLCCAYYYLSVPLVLLAVLGMGAGLIFLVVALGYIPIKLLVIVAIFAFVTVGGVIKSFFVRGSDEDPGEVLDFAEAGALRAALDEVAAKVGTRPVDRVYLTVGTDLAVFERGGLWAKLRGKGERCLILGVGVLDGLDARALKAILAHEYGHFSNEDTAGGNLALGVRRSVVHSIVALAEGGAAAWYNPAWLFMTGFHKVFLRVSQGASRLQEVLADRWSARTYGGASFERGLRHVIAAEVRFTATANAALKEVLEGGDDERSLPLPNLYRFQLTRPPGRDVDSWEDFEAKVASTVEQALNEEPSPYDSHPRPVDRFRWAHALSVDESAVDDGGPAWSLFDDREAVERRMTSMVRTNIEVQTGRAFPG